MLTKPERQQGSWSLFIYLQRKRIAERQRERRASADNMSEWTQCNIFFRHHGSFMSCMACAWNMSPCGAGCVCVPSITVGADECEVRHIPTSSLSLTLSCRASPSCHTWVEELVEAWSLHKQFCTNTSTNIIFFFTNKKKINILVVFLLCDCVLLCNSCHETRDFNEKWTWTRGLESEANAEVPEICILSNEQQRATPLVANIFNFYFNIMSRLLTWFITSVNIFHIVYGHDF